jgi:hypothetical protein
LKEITDNCETGIEDNNNINYGDNKSAIPPFEKTRGTETIQSQIPKKNKSIKQKERGIEPPTRKKQGVSERSLSSDEKKRKARRKTAKKKQVRPEKEKRTDSMDPVGKDVIPNRRYNHKKDMDPLPSSSKRRMEREKSPTPKNTENIEQNRNRDDPPMVVRGCLEVEGSPPHWNDDHLSIEKKTRRKKRHEKYRSRDGSESRNRADSHSKQKGRFPEDIEMNMNSVVSSRMDRGDEGWSISSDEVNAEEEDEINLVPRHVDIKKSNNHRQEDDPWKEIPCSCCCRYLPHTLVIATTHAYRLDRADEKDRELMDSKK